jgi:hypothetical protein
MNNFVDKLGDLLIVFLVVGLPAMLIFGRPYFRRWAELKEKQLDGESRLAAEKAAQYATANTALEQRVRVLEQIVTDGGMQTAAQIEALRPARLTGEKTA